MGKGEDNLRRRCEQMLEPDERILLAAEVQGKIGMIHRLDPGRAYLTPSRVIWLSRKIPIIHLLHWFHRIPDSFSIPIADIRRVIPGKELSSTWLLILTDKQQYSLRLGREPFFWLRDTAATTQTWADRIQELREAYRHRIQS